MILIPASRSPGRPILPLGKGCLRLAAMGINLGGDFPRPAEFQVQEPKARLIDLI
jgi:hypothetical protein